MLTSFIVRKLKNMQNFDIIIYLQKFWGNKYFDTVPEEVQIFQALWRAIGKNYQNNICIYPLTQQPRFWELVLDLFAYTLNGVYTSLFPALSLIITS